jgi:hypothetical protein
MSRAVELFGKEYIETRYEFCRCDLRLEAGFERHNTHPNCKAFTSNVGFVSGSRFLLNYLGVVL